MTAASRRCGALGAAGADGTVTQGGYAALGDQDFGLRIPDGLTRPGPHRCCAPTRVCRELLTGKRAV
jgi:hypothetical protein